MGGPANEASRKVDATDGGEPILSAELDELTRAFKRLAIGQKARVFDLKAVLVGVNWQIL
jgi:hypothetical protein